MSILREFFPLKLAKYARSLIVLNGYGKDIVRHEPYNLFEFKGTVKHFPLEKPPDFA